jgi:hypothetical protein
LAKPLPLVIAQNVCFSEFAISLSEFARLIERGLSKPRLDVADDIAEALEISFSQLIAEAEPKRRASCA